jgi:hypothetical protein
MASSGSLFASGKWKLDWPQSQSGHGGKQKNLLPTPITEHRFPTFPTCSLVMILIEIASFNVHKDSDELWLKYLQQEMYFILVLNIILIVHNLHLDYIKHSVRGSM